MNTVLIIDDDLLVARTIGKVLIKAGYLVFLAPDGNAGLAKFHAEQPDLVVTDLIMPEKEGIETIRELRAAAPGLPIVAMSGGGSRGNQDFLSMARKLGASEVLSKPFSNDELLTVVGRYLEPTGGFGAFTANTARAAR